MTTAPALKRYINHKATMTISLCSAFFPLLVATLVLSTEVHASSREELLNSANDTTFRASVPQVRSLARAKPTRMPTTKPTNPNIGKPTSHPTSKPTLHPTSMPTVTPATNTLTQQIICGYQGWFAYKGDGAPINRWKHWFDDPASSEPIAGNLHVDMFPVTDEYDQADLGISHLLMTDGTNATFFSNVKPRVVLKHFEWMAQYGISGVFHMRFMEGLSTSANNREWKTMVLRNVRNAAEATGRLFAVSYNIAGNSIDDSVLNELKVDWMRLVDEERITQSNRYIRHGGLPVLRIFGIGFKTVNVANIGALAELIDWFQKSAESKYRVFLIGGVPSRWRDRVNDAREEPEWKGIYDALDGIHPWHVGRWSTTASFETYYSNIISLDASYCASKGVLYMPTMFPGFSWHNMNKDSPINSIPRLGGNFMWAQAYRYVADKKINTIWMAQFDEVDEGTAIFKVASRQSDVPVDGKWLTLDADGQSLPSDWYLSLCGEAQKMLAKKIKLTSKIPIKPNLFA
mmetsp:Transcript_24166/g.48507  ORF Transcript_24166/g.48507 Transcript_24166/m.48507 type:complete len:517 (+) Transcript_24166:308-1858(+)